MNRLHKFLEGSSRGEYFYKCKIYIPGRPLDLRPLDLRQSRPDTMVCLHGSGTEKLQLKDLNGIAAATSIQDLSIYLLDSSVVIRKLAQLRCEEIQEDKEEI